MFYEIENGKINARAIDDVSPENQNPCFGFFSPDESREVLQKFRFNSNLLTESAKSSAMSFENHEGYDFMCVNILNHKTLTHTGKVFIFIRRNVILFLCSNASVLDKIAHTLTEDENVNLGFDRLLCTFFERYTVLEVGYLDKIEQEISDLENALIESRKRDCVKEIISLRKRLMALKRYYEQLLNVLDELEENENDILSENSLRYFKIFAGKAERHYHNIMNLRDYVTQVRESYQAEVDIGLNNIMKIFTVITAVFLPLSLIAGWYGMNLKMPEYNWAFGYPMVIILSVLVVVFCIAYFKKNKWF